MTRRAEADIHRDGLTGEPADHLLTLKQVGERLGISARLVRDHVKEGRLRAIDVGAGKVNQCLRFTSADISDFLRNRQAVPCPSIKGQALKPTRSTSSSKVVDIREALDQLLGGKPRNSFGTKRGQPEPGKSGKPPAPAAP